MAFRRPLLFVVTLLFGTNIASLFALQVSQYPVTVTQHSTVADSVAWTSLGNARLSPDDIAAEVSLPAWAVSHSIVATNFGFNITSDAVIEGVEVTWRKSATSAAIVDDHIALVVAGQIATSSNQCDTLPGDFTCHALSTNGTYHDDVYGGPLNTWGLNLNASTINDPGFGASLRVRKGAGAPRKIAYVESAKITVFYSVPTPTQATVAFTENSKQTATIDRTAFTQDPLATQTEQQTKPEISAGTNMAVVPFCLLSMMLLMWL